MRSTIMAFAAAASLSVVGFGAQAMPAQVSASPAASPLLTLVAQGCGPGFRLGPGGACRPIGGRAVVVERPVVVARPAVVVRRPFVRPGCGVRVGPIGVRTPC